MASVKSIKQPIYDIFERLEPRPDNIIYGNMRDAKQSNPYIRLQWLGDNADETAIDAEATRSAILLVNIGVDAKTGEYDIDGFIDAIKTAFKYGLKIPLYDDKKVLTGESVIVGAPISQNDLGLDEYGVFISALTINFKYAIK